MWKIFSVPCGSALYKFHCILYNGSQSNKHNAARHECYGTFIIMMCVCVSKNVYMYITDFYKHNTVHLEHKASES
jgi:hypothetical protein